MRESAEGDHVSSGEIEAQRCEVNSRLDMTRVIRRWMRVKRTIWQGPGTRLREHCTQALVMTRLATIIHFVETEGLIRCSSAFMATC